jgi:hypothetical protein
VLDDTVLDDTVLDDTVWNRWRAPYEDQTITVLRVDTL